MTPAFVMALGTAGLVTWVAILIAAIFFYSRGGAHFHKGEYRRAKRAFDWALLLTPNFYPARNDRAVTYVRLGKYAWAIEEYGKAIELKPDLAEAYGNRGAVYAQLGAWGKAFADLNKAIELKPSFAAAYRARGQAYKEIGERDGAMRDWQTYLELEPEEADRAQILAEIEALGVEVKDENADKVIG
jgi:tetratricopeptide (TPR) repeat protein